jgi:hypothetical protein
MRGVIFLRKMTLGAYVSVKFPTGFTDPRGMKLCPIHRTSLFLSDGWDSVELHDDIAFC